MKPKAIDLFCGAGGLSCGLERAGFDVLGAFDAWDIAIESHRLNFAHPAVCADLATLSASDIWKAIGGRPPSQLDLLVGGPPCQGFSIQRIGADRDERNSLVLEFARLVKEVSPTFFLMENVLGLLGKRGQALLTEFAEILEEAGYCFEAVRVNAAEFGVPQLRRRVIFLGWREDHIARPSLPAPTTVEANFRTVAQAIGDLPSPPDDLTPLPGDPLHRRTWLAPQNLERLRLIPPGGGMQDLPVHLRADCHKDGADRIGHRYVYGRLASDRPASTITARFDSFTRGKFAHPVEHRNITLREGARLQTFEDSFRFVGTQEEIAAQIGNAVPPLLAETIARELAEQLQIAPAPARRRGGAARE